MTRTWKSLEQSPKIKIGDLVRNIPSAHHTDINRIGVVVEVGINMWGEEMIPSGVAVLWSDENEIEVEYEDEVERV